MQTFNWFFGLDDESENKVPTDGGAVAPPAPTGAPERNPQQATATASSVHKEETPAVASPTPIVSQPAASAPSAAHHAQTGVFVVPGAGSGVKEPSPAQSTPLSPSSQAAPIKKVAPATQVAYVPSGPPVLPIASKAALADAQAQLKGAIPVSLQTKPASPSAPKSKSAPASRDSRRKKLQTGLLAGSAVAVLGAVIWSFLPATASPPSLVSKPVSPLTPPQHTATTASEHAERESAASRCIKDSTEFMSSAVRDQLLLEAVTAFEKGRLEQAQSLFEKYSSISCDHATLEATAVLQRQLGARNPER